MIVVIDYHVTAGNDGQDIARVAIGRSYDSISSAGSLTRITVRCGRVYSPVIELDQLLRLLGLPLGLELQRLRVQAEDVLELRRGAVLEERRRVFRGCHGCELPLTGECCAVCPCTRASSTDGRHDLTAAPLRPGLVSLRDWLAGGVRKLADLQLHN